MDLDLCKPGIDLLKIKIECEKLSLKHAKADTVGLDLYNGGLVSSNLDFVRILVGILKWGRKVRPVRLPSNQNCLSGPFGCRCIVG